MADGGSRRIAFCFGRAEETGSMICHGEEKRKRKVARYG